MKFRFIVSSACLLGVLSACAGYDALERSEPTLADLEKVQAPAVDDVLPNISRQQVMDSYKTLLTLTDDPEIRARSMSRLGDLMMLESEDRQLDSSDDVAEVQRRYYEEVVQFYKQLLEEQPNRADNDSLYYQLSKAYDLDTRQEESADSLDRLVRKFPDSPYAAEAHFRTAEILFADGQYQAAQNEYDKVIRFGMETPFFDNALYMKGWAEFKRGRYEESLFSFWRVMNRIYPKDVQKDGLTKGARSLVVDTERVMALALSYLEGADSIRWLRSEAGEMHYEKDLFASLAELYLSKKRYRDTADTYQAFIDDYPQSNEAPAYNVLQIEAFEKGNFPTEVLPAKQRYVESYGIKSDYWDARDETQRETLKPKLHEYLSLLSKVSHSEAQQMKALWAKTAGSKRERRKLKFAESEIYDEYRLASRWYKEYLLTFPTAKDAASVWFLLAESQYEARDFQDSINTYQRIAYAMPEHPKGAEAGYAALIAYEKHIEVLRQSHSDEPSISEQGISEQGIDERGIVERWEDRRIASSIRFAENYPNDKRAANVLVKASEDLLAKGAWPQAVNSARMLISWKTPVEPSLKIGAWLVIAHGEFEQNRYSEAEVAYSRLRELMPQNDQRRAGVEENLAASIYKQGELALSEDNKAAAIDQFLRVAMITPGVAIAANAQFDAATHMLALERWSEAIGTLKAFRANHPKHELSNQIGPKLILAYQETEQWSEAAAELDVLARNNKDPESARSATYLSAELYQKAGDSRKSIGLYERYVKLYPQPQEQQLEAIYQLSEMQKASANTREYEKWLKALITLDKKMGAQRTDRSRFLAAGSTLYFADSARTEFDSIKLSLPLKKSLGRKKKALNKTLDLYEEAASFQVQEYATRATFNIAEIYAQLSSDLMDSDRPANMNELELEQYEVLLEEQAFPFEEQAIEIHETNAQRAWSGIFDKWVQSSLESLAVLMPGRYQKQELVKERVDAIQ